MINPKKLNTDKKYFADTHYMSVSRYKRFAECEELGLIPFGEVTEAMKIGSFVDSYVSGTLEQFKKDNPDIISSRGKTKGELKVGFKKAEEICDYIDNNPRIQQFLQGDKQTVMTGEIEGVPFKIKMDIYAEDIVISDLKIMASITDRRGNYYDFISPWGYDIQLACYQEIVRQNTDKTLPTFIIAITKEEVVNSAIIEIPQEILDTALETVKSSISRYYSIMKGELQAEGCGKCSVCIQKRKDVPIISMYEIMEGEM